MKNYAALWMVVLDQQDWSPRMSVERKVVEGDSEQATCEKKTRNAHGGKCVVPDFL